MKISFVATVFQEEKTIEALLESLHSQTKKPNEIILVDGGSDDKTEQLLDQYKNAHTDFPLRILIKKGNRSIGRNEGIKKASGDIILLSDAGCVLDTGWVEEIVKPFADTTVDVVAGYYQGKTKTIFETCLIPYVLVMPDRVDPKTFLPATRSMAFRKKVWEKVKGFPEKYSHNEDYVFAQTLRKSGADIVFAKKAIVYWIPRQNLIQAAYMFYRFALGDAEAGLWREKVLLQFARYGIALIVLSFFIITKSLFFLWLLLGGFILYSMWAIVKNYRYVKDVRACFFLPVLQYTADVAVIYGTLTGFLQNRRVN